MCYTGIVEDKNYLRDTQFKPVFKSPESVDKWKTPDIEKQLLDAKEKFNPSSAALWHLLTQYKEIYEKITKQSTVQDMPF